MKLLAYIPARSGSKGVPGKNIKTIQGVPLIAFSIFSALKSNIFDEVLLSTDEPVYHEKVSKLGIRDDYIRPAELAGDHSPTVDGILHALDWYGDQGKTFDAVMLLQPPAPFRNPDHIHKAIEILQANPEATCVTGIVKLGDAHPARVKRLVNEKWLAQFCNDAPEHEPSRRQDFTPPAYLRNGTIYLSRIDTIRRQKLVWGERVIGMEMSEANSINVDRQIDFLTAEAALSYGPYRSQLAFFDELVDIFSV